MYRQFLSAFIVCWMPSYMAHARPLDEVVASGVLRVAVYDHNKPWSTKQNGIVSGIDVDVARAIAEALKVRPEIVVFTASEDIGGDFRLNLWKGDLVGTTLSDLMLQVPNDPVLALRDDQVFLTAPYATQKIAFAYHVDHLGLLSSIDDLGENKVAVEETSPSDVDLMTRNAGQLRSNAAHFATFDEAMAAYEAGSVPIIGGTQVQIEAAFHERHMPVATNPILVPIINRTVKSQWELAGAVRSNSRDLAYAVGDVLAAMIKNGRMKKIYDAYGVTFIPPSPD